MPYLASQEYEEAQLNLLAWTKSIARLVKLISRNWDRLGQSFYLGYGGGAILGLKGRGKGSKERHSESPPVWIVPKLA